MQDEKKSSGNNQGKDLTADELLELLNKSMDLKSDPKVVERINADKSSHEALKIDESVFESAEREFRNSDAVTASDDSDLDVDALIEKYINQPKNETPENPLVDEAGEEIVHEIERDAADEEITVSDEGSLLSEPTELMDDDSDVKIAEDIADDLPAAVEADASESDMFADADTEKTAVFDISRVKQLAEDDDPEIERLVDEAFERSETEVFKPVTDDMMLPESVETDAVGETVYGEAGGEEIDQTDLNLMLAFGMNEELKETVGEEQAIAIEDDILQKHEQTAQMQAVEEPVEFTSRDQIGEILTAYKSRYYTLAVRIAAAIALIAALFVVENFSLLGLTMPKFMRPTSYPVVYAMIDLQLVVLCGVLVWKQVVDGVKSLIALKPTPESLTAFVLAMSVIYTFASCLSAPMEGFALYNLPVVFAVLLSLIYEFMNLKRDVFSFNVVSSKKKKFVVTPVSDTTESLEREVFNDYVPSDSQIIRVGKTDFVDGFFARINEKGISKPIIGITIPVVMILSVAFFIISYIANRSVYTAFTMAFVTAVVTAPLTTFIIYSYPFYKASKDSYDNDSAIIGESSLVEYSGSSVISFEDKEVFPSGGVKVTSIKVYGNNRIDEIIYSLASAFIKVGGPLADVFSQATHDMGYSEDVELIEVEDDGFTVTIDDVQVYIGKASYMEKKDYEPPFDSEAKKQELNASLGVLYIAFGGQLAAKVYVHYTIDSEFEAILAQLYKTGICVGIKSFDPNIDDLLLAKKIKAMKYPVKVIRSKTVEDIPHTFERCDSGIVSKRSVKALLKTVTLCERVSNAIKTNLIVKVLAMLIGVVVMVFIHAFGNSVELSSLYIMLYQLFWTIPVLLISRFLV